MSDKCPIKAILYTKENGKITNSDYQKINGISRETASRFEKNSRIGR